MVDSNFLQWQETLCDFITQSIRTMYTARIESYDAITRRANVKIMGNFKVDESEYSQIPILTDVPVAMMVSGNFFISLPIKPNTYGRLCIFSQDVDEYKSFGGNNYISPTHDFNFHNSLFIPDFNPFNSVFANHDADDLVIGSTNGGITLSFSPTNELIIKQNNVEKFKLDTSGNIIKTIAGNDTETIVGSKSITATDINLTGVTNITGETTITGITSMIGALNPNDGYTTLSNWEFPDLKAAVAFCQEIQTRLFPNT